VNFKFEFSHSLSIEDSFNYVNANESKLTRSDIFKLDFRVAIDSLNLTRSRASYRQSQLFINDNSI